MMRSFDSLGLGVTIMAFLYFQTVAAAKAPLPLDSSYATRSTHANTAPKSTPIKSSPHKTAAATADPLAQKSPGVRTSADIAIPENYYNDPNRTPIARAKYWKTKGFAFDPNKMSAYEMDDRGEDLERAAYWKSKGYNFDPNQVCAREMNERVADIERAKYWRQKGYFFDPNLMSTSSKLAVPASAELRKK